MRKNASPLAQRIARLSGLDLNTVTTASGDGRIRARDVLTTLTNKSPRGDRVTSFTDGSSLPTRESGDPGICLEVPCDARPLLALADAAGGALAKVPFEHAVIFMVAHALTRVPGMVSSSDREASATARIAVSVGSDRHATISLDTCGRRILSLSQDLSRLAADADPKPEMNIGYNDADILVTFSAQTGVRNLSADTAGFWIPVLNVNYCASGESAHLRLTWTTYLDGSAKAGEFLLQLRRLIEEPRRLLL